MTNAVQKTIHCPTHLPYMFSPFLMVMAGVTALVCPILLSGLTLTLLVTTSTSSPLEEEEEMALPLRAWNRGLSCPPPLMQAWQLSRRNVVAEKSKLRQLEIRLANLFLRHVNRLSYSAMVWVSRPLGLYLCKFECVYLYGTVDTK